jgi:hypothetical protein
VTPAPGAGAQQAPAAATGLITDEPVIPVPPATPVLGPQELLPTRPARLTFTPTITVFEEYNDNVLLDNRRRISDWITGFAPGFAFDWRGSIHRMAVAYDFVAETYSRRSSFGDAFSRQNLVVDSMYRPAQQVTLTLTDNLISSLDTSAISPTGVATGRSRSWSNTVTPGVAWEINPLWTARFSGTHTALRYDRSDLVDSDIYRLTPSAERRITENLTGVAAYEFGAFDVEQEPNVTTNTPRVGARYRFNPTLLGSLSVGPTFETRADGKDRTEAAVTAWLRQAFQLGYIGLDYDRGVGTAGGLGGTTENDLIAARFGLTGLVKGLSADLTTSYGHIRSSIVKSSDRRIDLETLSVGIRTVYKPRPWMSLYFGYLFYEQLPSTAVGARADQNRISFGVLLGYPLRIE